MSLRVDQIFVKCQDTNLVSQSIHTYVSTIGKNFSPNPNAKLDGVEQTLRYSIKRKREFLLYTKNYWTVVWEKVDYSEFSDPAIAQFLSDVIGTETIWLKFDDDFNIWAFQKYNKGIVVESQFLPKSYFLGQTDSPDLFSYGSCHEFADEFNQLNQLPAFLVTFPVLERQKKLYASLQNIICKLPVKAY
jgi:hypothetical protein